MQWPGKLLIGKANFENVSRETSPCRFCNRTEWRSIYQRRSARRNERRPSSVGGRLGLSAWIYQQGRQIREEACGDKHGAEEQRVHAQDCFLLSMNYG